MSAAESVSANVGRMRRACGWTQAEAAERFSAILGAPFTRDAWMHAERPGKPRQRSWTVNELVAVAELFGVAVGELIVNNCSRCQGAPPAGFTCRRCGVAS